jgi:hypothetical protein
VLLDREVREERVDLRFTHVIRVLLPMEQDESPTPVLVRVFGPKGVVAYPARDPEPVEQFGLAGGGGPNFRALRSSCGCIEALAWDE